MRFRIGWCVATLGALGAANLGCSGQAVDAGEEPGGMGGEGATGGTDSTGGTTSTGGTETGGSGGSGPPSPGYEELCAATGGNEITFADEADATELMAGKWVLCRGPGLVFATEQPGQAGVEITTDMLWYVLEPSGSGLARASGFQASGTWRFQPPQDLNYGPAMTAMLFMGADYSFMTMSMLDSPRKMRVVFTALGGEASIYAFVEP
jgi:hypothetical protein